MRPTGRKREFLWRVVAPSDWPMISLLTKPTTLCKSGNKKHVCCHRLQWWRCDAVGSCTIQFPNYSELYLTAAFVLQMGWSAGHKFFNSSGSEPQFPTSPTGRLRTRSVPNRMRLFIELENGRDFLRVVTLSPKFNLFRECSYAFVIKIKFNSPFHQQNALDDDMIAMVMFISGRVPFEKETFMYPSILRILWNETSSKGMEVNIEDPCDLDGKQGGVHAATLHPSKQAGKTPANKNPADSTISRISSLLAMQQGKPFALKGIRVRLCC
ncbi:hypothetical protein HAX54_044018 [Datura stramonium]|uniref:Uncharacterized protein n=1 Tax=Datura stramonium TaxID=4076 RepID=A0ABS8W638_DATST|nr:hypothetical protein [Datura stramonium]